jgi:hypothetical protein
MTIKHKTINGAINFQKRKLINKAKKQGLYENFGQDEVRAIEDKFIDTSSYTDEMNKNRSLLSSFNNWAMNFDLSNLQKNL